MVYQTLHWTELTPYAVGELAAYRYQVFVDHLGWPLDCDHERGEELDEFDLTGDTRYILQRNRQHQLTGCARVMPAEQGNVSRKLFSGLFERYPLPDMAGSWELSRSLSDSSDRSEQDGRMSANKPIFEANSGSI